MSGLFGYSREAVRVKVKKCEANLPPEWRKFSVDPQITSLEVLFSILAKAFDLKTDFTISYKTIDPMGQELFLAVLSDWDLDAAFLRAHNLSISTSSEPCLNLKVDIKPFSETTDWESSSNCSTKEASSIQQSIGVGQKYVQNMQNRLPGLIMNQMEKTFSIVTRALNFAEDQNLIHPLRAPLSDSEFRTFNDSVGQIIHPLNLRSVIFKGGIDPSLRRVVWKHILNVYPDGMTGRERMDYMKKKAAEYIRLREVWRMAVQKGPVIGELAYVTSMVRKDVLRTDRLHPFYAGSDDNQNIAALFNVLTTYALNHPAVSYCQGMSDIASPLLVTTGDEAQAYICFCAVMKRLSVNFMLDGIAMTLKFTHLSEALQFYDPEFFEYLKQQQADDLLFCYRWLLLEMKREFAFEDSLRMLEVLWSSLPPEPPTTELPLFEKEFTAPVDLPPPKSPSAILMRTPRENAYIKLCNLRRQSSSQSLLPTSPSGLKSYDVKSLDTTKRLNQSLDENITRSSNSTSKYAKKSFQSLDETKMVSMLEHHAQSNVSIVPHDQSDTTANASSIENPRGTQTQTTWLEADKNLRNQQKSRSTSPNTENEDTIGEVVDDKSISVGRAGSLKNKHTATQSNINVTRRGHFRELKEKLAAGKKGIFASLDKIEHFQFDSDSSSKECSEKSTTKSSKIVKNFNEFLTFAPINKSGISPKVGKPTVVAADGTAKPSIKLTKSSFDDSDSSSIAETSTNSTEKDSGNGNTETVTKSMMQLQFSEKKQISLDGSSPDDSQEYFPMTTSMTRELRLELENLNRHVFGNSFNSQQFTSNPNIDVEEFVADGNEDCETPESNDSLVSSRSPANFSEISYIKLNQNSTEQQDEDHQQADKIYQYPSDRSINGVVRNRIRNSAHYDENTALKRISTSSANADVFVWENPLHQISPTTTFADIENEEKIPLCNNGSNASTPDEQNELDYDGEIIDESAFGKKSVTPIRLLRKGGDDGIGTNPNRSNGSSKRNSRIYRKDSDSESSTEVSCTDNYNHLPPKPSKTTTTTTAAATTTTTELPVPSNVLVDKSSASNSPVDEEASEANIVLRKVGISLPPPTEFGGGNPFLMFLCLTLLIQHRNYVIKNNMDYNEMAMHFDKMVRKHNVVRVLNQARRMYAEYLKSQNIFNTVGSMKSNKNSNNNNK